MSERYIHKLRPIRLDKVIGQDRNIKEIVTRLESGTLSDANIFYGSTGTGKTTITRILMMILECESPVDSELFGKKYHEPCGECFKCKAIRESKFDGLMNIKYLKGNQSGVDDIRKLTDFINTKSFSKYRIIFVDELQGLLSGSAKESLLELIETERENLYWFFTTKFIDKIPKDVVHRCSGYRLYQPTFEIVGSYLYSILTDNKIEYPESFIDDNGGLFTIAENCGGSLRYAVEILEKCVRGEYWTEDEVLQSMSSVSHIQTVEIIQKLVSRDKSFFFEFYDMEESCSDFFYLSYSILKDMLIYFETGYLRFKWQRDRFNKFKKHKDEVLKTIKIYDDIQSSGFFKESLYFSKMIQHFSNITSELKSKPRPRPSK